MDIGHGQLKSKGAAISNSFILCKFWWFLIWSVYLGIVCSLSLFYSWGKSVDEWARGWASPTATLNLNWTSLVRLNSMCNTKANPIIISIESILFAIHGLGYSLREFRSVKKLNLTFVASDYDEILFSTVSVWMTYAYATHYSHSTHECLWSSDSQLIDSIQWFEASNPRCWKSPNTSYQLSNYLFSFINLQSVIVSPSHRQFSSFVAMYVSVDRSQGPCLSWIY